VGGGGVGGGGVLGGGGGGGVGGGGVFLGWGGVWGGRKEKVDESRGGKGGETRGTGSEKSEK